MLRYENSEAPLEAFRGFGAYIGLIGSRDYKGLQLRG